MKLNLGSIIKKTSVNLVIIYGILIIFKLIDLKEVIHYLNLNILGLLIIIFLVTILVIKIDFENIVTFISMVCFYATNYVSDAYFITPSFYLSVILISLLILINIFLAVKWTE